MPETEDKKLKMLDCFCGMGGVSDGFALEGFNVTGIDIEDAPNKLGYKHKFIQADITTLNGTDFQGYAVIWGSPPCRDFTKLGNCFGSKWKRPPQPEKGMETINVFLQFIEKAQPKFWIMENVARASNFVPIKPKQTTKIMTSKNHCFWGNYPPFIMPQLKKTLYRTYYKNDGSRTSDHKHTPNCKRKLQQWTQAKIPLTCSQAFAKACKEALKETVLA